MKDIPQMNVSEVGTHGIMKLNEKDMYAVWVKTAYCNLASKQLRN